MLRKIAELKLPKQESYVHTENIIKVLEDSGFTVIVEDDTGCTSFCIVAIDEEKYEE